MSVRPHVSFSEFGLWNTCQWRWFRDYREDRRSETNSAGMLFGKVMHDVLEKLKDPEPEKQNPTVAESLKIFEESFRAKYAKIRDSEPEEKRLSDEDVELWIKGGQSIIKGLDECQELSDAKVLFVELPLLEKMDRTDGVEIKFKGFIDLVIKTKDKRGNSIVYIVDYKTCSWGWNREKRQDEDLLMQLRLYKHFFSKKFNIDPKFVRTAFVLLKRTPRGKDHPVEWLPFSSGDKTTMRAVLRLNEAVTGMETNNYKKNRDACVNKYGDVCPYFKTPLCTED